MKPSLQSLLKLHSMLQQLHLFALGEESKLEAHICRLLAQFVDKRIADAEADAARGDAES